MIRTLFRRYAGLVAATVVLVTIVSARRLIDRKLSSTRGLPPEQRTRRLAGLLARKGYPAALAFRVIREALEAEGDLAFPEDEPPFDEDDPSAE